MYSRQKRLKMTALFRCNPKGLIIFSTVGVSASLPASGVGHSWKRSHMIFLTCIVQDTYSSYPILQKWHSLTITLYIKPAELRLNKNMYSLKLAWTNLSKSQRKLTISQLSLLEGPWISVHFAKYLTSSCINALIASCKFNTEQNA